MGPPYSAASGRSTDAHESRPDAGSHAAHAVATTGTLPAPSTAGPRAPNANHQHRSSGGHPAHDGAAWVLDMVGPPHSAAARTLAAAALLLGVQPRVAEGGCVPAPQCRHVFRHALSGRLLRVRAVETVDLDHAVGEGRVSEEAGSPDDGGDHVMVSPWMCGLPALMAALDAYVGCLARSQGPASVQAAQWCGFLRDSVTPLVEAAVTAAGGRLASTQWDALVGCLDACERGGPSGTGLTQLLNSADAPGVSWLDLTLEPLLVDVAALDGGLEVLVQYPRLWAWWCRWADSAETRRRRRRGTVAQSGEGQRPDTVLQVVKHHMTVSSQAAVDHVAVLQTAAEHGAVLPAVADQGNGPLAFEDHSSETVRSCDDTALHERRMRVRCNKGVGTQSVYHDCEHDDKFTCVADCMR